MNRARMDALVSLMTCVTLTLTLSNHAPNQDQEVAIIPPPKKFQSRAYF